MKWVKKITSIVIASFILFSSVVPALAYTGGLMDGKPIQMGSGNSVSNDSTTLVTDSNNATSQTISGASTDGRVNDTFWYHFPNTVTITDYKLYITGGSYQDFTLAFYDASGNQVGALTPTNIGATKVSITPINNVYKVALFNRNVGDRVVVEMDVFGSVNDTTPPADVTGVSISNITDTKATVTFNKNTTDSDISSYKVYLNDTLATTLDKSLNTFTFSNLTASTSYTVKVTSLDANNNESSGTTAKTTFTTIETPDFTPPGEVSSVVGLGDSESSIKLQWVPPSDSDLKQFNVWRDGVFVASVPKGTNTYTDTGLSTQPGGKPYQYTLITEDNAGNKSAGIQTTVRTADRTPPDEVSNAHATVLSDTAVKLDWENPSGPNNTDLTSIEIYVGSNLIYSATTSETTWTHIGLNPKTTYTWVLRTKDSSLNLSPGVSVSAQTLGTSDPPGNLQGTPGDGKADLQWAAPAGTIQGYNLYQDGKKINNSPITGTSYTVTGLKNGETYQFEVSAVNVYGESPHSTAISVKPYILGKITGLTATERTKSYVKFAWNKESSAERYHVDITIKHRQTAAAGVSDFAAGETSTTTFGIETSSNDVTVTGLTAGDTVTAAVSGYNSIYGIYGTASTSAEVPTVDVPQLKTTPTITAGDVFQSGVSLASNFWLYLLLGLSFILVPWIYSLIRRSTTTGKGNDASNESPRGQSRELNRDIRQSLRGGSK